MGPPGIPWPGRHGRTKETGQAPTYAAHDAFNLRYLDQRAMEIERGSAGLNGNEKSGLQIARLANELDRVADKRAAAGVLLINFDIELMTEGIAERCVLAPGKPMRGIESEGLHQRRERRCVFVRPLIDRADRFADDRSRAFAAELREDLAHRVGKAVGNTWLSHCAAFGWKTAGQLQSTDASFLPYECGMTIVGRGGRPMLVNAVAAS